MKPTFMKWVDRIVLFFLMITIIMAYEETVLCLNGWINATIGYIACDFFYVKSLLKDKIKE